MREREQEQHRGANKYHSDRCSINARQALDGHRNRIRREYQRSERSIAAEKIIACIGKCGGFVAFRRRGNVNAHHPSMIAMTPLEIRQIIGVGTSNNPNSGRRLEPSVIMNPS